MPVTLRQCVGVTASDVGLTMPQLRVAYLMLKALKQRGYTQFRHGDCINGDEDLAGIAWAMGYEIVGHPPTDESRRAFFPSDFNEPPEPYLDRNHRIVQKAQYMLALPTQTHIILRDGVWATFRYSIGFPRAGTLIWRNGTTAPFSRLDLSKAIEQGT